MSPFSSLNVTVCQKCEMWRRFSATKHLGCYCLQTASCNISKGYLFPYNITHRPITISQPPPSMASLGLVSSGAATDGVTPIFFLKKTGDLFWSSVSLCHPAPFLPVRPLLSTILGKFSHKKLFSFGCHIEEGVTRSGPPSPSPPSPSVVTPLAILL